MAKTSHRKSMPPTRHIEHTIMKTIQNLNPIVHVHHHDEKYNTRELLSCNKPMKRAQKMIGKFMTSKCL